MIPCTTTLRVPTRRRYERLATGVLLTVALVAGCRHPPVRTEPALQALDVPPPPPRNVEPTDSQVPPQVPLVEVPARPPERPRATPASPPRDASRVDPKPEPVAEPIRTPDDAKPASTLQTTSTDREAEVDRKIRGTLQTATADLSRVDYRRLSPDVQVQYDTAKSFIRQADEALKSRNQVFAQTMADKAATLASQLAGR